jgi:hypothetical protein
MRGTNRVPLQAMHTIMLLHVVDGQWPSTILIIGILVSDGFYMLLDDTHRGVAQSLCLLASFQYVHCI